MRIKIAILSFLFFSLSFISMVGAETSGGMPLKYISSCELDFNKDNVADIALLVETMRGWELIVLMRTAKGYNAFLVSTDKKNMYLSCHFGSTIKETYAGSRAGKVYKTPGTYIELKQQEGSSVVYFWDQKEFQEVWTSD